MPRRIARTTLNRPARTRRIGPYNQGQPFPWRAGADENTIISFSDNVKINGKDIPAGDYGLHIIPNKDEWTFILSKNATSWGSFFYDEKEDILRVNAKPVECAHQEWLEFEFINAARTSVELALRWEKIQASFKIDVDVDKIVLQNMRNELRSTAAFSWVGWHSAAEYCLQYDVNLEEALEWVNNSINRQANFTNLSTKSQILEKLNKSTEAKAAMQKALEAGTIQDLHGYGRRLIAEKKAKEALEVFKLNAKKHPNTWPVNLGLGRGYMALGDSKNALKYYKIALKEAPDETNRESLKDMISDLEEK